MKFKHYVANYIINPPHELSVAVIGCGGTGSQVMTALGRMNYALRQLGHPGLQVAAYDADIVTLANMGMAILWKLFRFGMIDIHGAYLNLETMRMNPIKVTKI